MAHCRQVVDVLVFGTSFQLLRRVASLSESISDCRKYCALGWGGVHADFYGNRRAKVPIIFQYWSVPERHHSAVSPIAGRISQRAIAWNVLATVQDKDGYEFRLRYESNQTEVVDHLVIHTLCVSRWASEDATYCECSFSSFCTALLPSKVNRGRRKQMMRTFGC